ncbi:MAG TPA: hypothetical protein VI818_02815, partial [Candidatus Thermoplasmatota archaeon]|nr:hypothetical protein [Candidatus Thermoplasmatota archaeon]
QSKPQDMLLGLSFDPNATTSPSRQYSFRTPTRVYYCLQPTFQYCPSQPFAGDATLIDELQDIQLQPQHSFLAVLALSWTYSASITTPPFTQPPTVMVQAELIVSGVSYGVNGFMISGTRGDKVIPLDFHRDAGCEDQDGYDGGCETVDKNATVEELWSHDVVLRLRMQRLDYQYVSLGDQFNVKLDTSGRSLLEVHELPPPVELAAAAAGNESADGDSVEIEWQDEDADGEHDLDEVALVPAPGLFGAAAALAGLAWLRRRRLG